MTTARNHHRLAAPDTGVSRTARACRLRFGFSLGAALFAASLGTSLPTRARAQDDADEEKKPDLPVKKATPFMDQRALQIPSAVPQLQGAPLKPKVEAPRLELSRPRMQAQAQGKTPEAANPGARPTAPARPAAPPPSPGSRDFAPNIADLKQAGGKSCVPMPLNTRVTFDFKGDVQELIEAISKVTCKNFILTNKVRSQKFEILSPSPITVEEAWRAFLSALEANDFSVIQVGRYYKIIQATDGPRSPTPIYGSGERAPINDRMVTVIWRPKHAADVNAVVNYLNIFKSTRGQIHPFQGTGTIIATDFGTSIERLERILQEVDQPGALEQVHLVPVEFASATEIAEKLSQVFEPQRAAPGQAPKPGGAARLRMGQMPGVAETAPPMEGSAGGEQTDEDGIVAVSKILADERTNKLIIIASDRAFKQIMSLMRELDVPETATDGQIHVLRLKHASAEELATTLASLAQGRPTAGAGAAGAAGRARGRPAATPAAKPPGAAGASGAAGGNLFEGEVKVTADKATNSLVITASKSDLNSLKRVIDKLDVARYQVFVEAVILEVSVKRDRRVGVGWHGGIAPEIDGRRSPILFANTPTRELSSLLAGANPLSLAGLLGFAGAVRGPTLEGTESIVQGGIPSIGVVLQALQSTNDVNVISTPHLLTMDNEDAEIQVSEKRPFPSGLTLGGLGGMGMGMGMGGMQGGMQGGMPGLGALGGLGLGAVSFNREDVGLTLKLKPQINHEDYVRLEIDQELSDVAGIDQVTQQQITSKRAAKTVVVVRSQDSVVIGGLVRDRESIDESKLPLLGDLPVLGWLFKRQGKISEKVNLLLVLTPYIIRGPEDFRTIFERKMSERKEFVDRFYGTTPEYRASIDWSRKVGPLASYRGAIRREMRKAENEGPGGPDETIIRPDGVQPPPGAGGAVPPDTRHTESGLRIERVDPPVTDELPEGSPDAPLPLPQD